MAGTDDLRAALAEEISRRQLAEVRLAHCQRQLAEAHTTINALTQLVASQQGVTEVGVIAKAVLIDAVALEEAQPHRGLTAAGAP